MKSLFGLTHITAVLALVLSACCHSKPNGSANSAFAKPRPLADNRTWGIACLSVASARELPDHKAEMGTQVLMGEVVRVLGRNTNDWWYLVETPDGYRAWLEKGTFIRCTAAEAQAWTNSQLLLVVAPEALAVSEPREGAEPVSDLVVADLVKPAGREGDWVKVELPDHRTGFVPVAGVTEYAAWQARRNPTAQNIERTGRQFLGRPYLWGGNSPKGFDCSGFTKIVFFLNGISLTRNASQQAQQGTDVPLDQELSQLQKGDLLFFGRPARGGQPERIFHVGIYLGNKLFLHSSERVQVNSLDPASPIRDQHRIRTLLRARRVLP